MGQKTHPYGFRLGVIKTWNSRWYEDKNYAKWLHEDLALRKHVRTNYANAGVAGIEIERAANK
ncbi:MAG: 30S ribosomal protein S3, partial [Deltaproteobacteria bacterium]